MSKKSTKSPQETTITKLRNAKAPTHVPAHCSFCSQTGEHAGYLVSSSTGAAICFECVAAAAQIFDDVSGETPCAEENVQ